MGRPQQFWTVPREWPGETVIIIGGGPSVAQVDLAALNGRRVIAINSSYRVAPEADFLIFGDTRWWRQHQQQLAGFGGRIVTTAQAAMGKQLLKLRKVEPAAGRGLSEDRQALCMQRTTLHAALNLAAHLGAARILLLGADMSRAPDGRSHHHEPHPWKVKPGCWDEQLAQLELAAPALEALGIDIVNCSPVSRIGWWRKANFKEALDGSG